MSKLIINIDKLEYRSFGSGDQFGAERAEVAATIGAQKLGYGVVRLAPGKRAWPYHAHYVIEEAFFVLEGTGTLRHADEEYPLRTGDFICAPADPNQPHQIVNTSDRELVYLAISSGDSTDVVLYPDSDKYGVWHGDKRDLSNPDNFWVCARKSTAVDYWDGESDG